MDTKLHAIRDCRWCLGVREILLQPQQWNKFFKRIEYGKVGGFQLTTNAEDMDCKLRLEAHFRQAINTFWYWRNRVGHAESEDFSPYEFFVNDILNSIKSLESALLKPVNGRQSSRTNPSAGVFF